MTTRGAAWFRLPRRQGDEHGRVGPILIVAGVAVIAFVIALLAFRGGSKSSVDQATGGVTPGTAEPASTGACGEGQPDPTYTLAVDSDPNPPRPEGTTFHLTVRHNGAPVTGAKVCLAANMPTMQHAGVNITGKEASAGRYDAFLKFSMEGSWEATVTVAEPGKPSVSLPVTIQVAQPAGTS